MINLNGSQFQGGTKGVTLDPGTYSCTLKAARIYKDWNFEKDKTLTKLDLIWDTGAVMENDDGEEVEAMIYDSFIALSLNEKANFTKRITAILGGNFNPAAANLALEIDGADNLEELPMREEARLDVTRLEINGESVFGKEALVEVALNKNNYNKVTNVTAPMRQATKLKPRANQTEAPAAP